MIQILQENDFFIVLNKPPGVSVHNEKPSLLDFLQSQKRPPHFVSRLDRETSGLMIVAKTALLHETLSEALQQGTKTYRALLRNQWRESESNQWAWPLTDKAEGRDNPQGKTAERLPCESHVQVIRSNKFFTEAAITILTGRQHQIRKHSALAKHPIVGDGRYNDKKYNDMIADRYKISRMWLHAECLQFKLQDQDFKFENKINLDTYFS
ncbi:MAG: hypothetical protein A2622_10320 [Bdellovibrionales bacterium RIFCSPHIGHO2_01_FULL_40_29]|nr:MAG: hypothetical protein A2622_10320 [Bdellovibrionales bacterium RIFCSPHIGHO2_01_FULL_40_29]OFZ32364.1 MAG: hypothetical protein A3D17_12340 [Bdellovibrionales bacterium RIFCSPHIGHO2_02_FULL_40_15]